MANPGDVNIHSKSWMPPLWIVVLVIAVAAGGWWMKTHPSHTVVDATHTEQLRK